MTEIKGISVDEWKKKICEEAERLRPQLIELSHSIHDEPEIGFQEFKSSAKICDFLEKQGFSILREAMLTDEGKYYIVIEAARGTMRPGREQDYRFGADLIRKKDPVLLAYLEKEEKMTRQVLAGLTENDAQNKKETLEASEAGETAISRRAARINELTAYLALIEETRHEMQ